MATATPSPSAIPLKRQAAQGASAAAPASPSGAPANASASGSAQAEPTRDTLQTIAEHIECYLKSIGRELSFSVDEETHRTIITVRDAASAETIRQIPSEEMLRIARALGNQPNALIDLSI